MGIKIGGINMADAILNTEFRLLVLEKIVEKLLSASPPEVLTSEELEKIREDALKSIQKKYPDAGITRKS